jgi:hypothetical protein
MKSIGLCFSLFAMAMVAVLLVRPGGNASSPKMDISRFAESALSESDTVAEAPVVDEVVDRQESADESADPAGAELETVAKSTKPDTEPVDPRTKGVVIKKSSAAARAKGEITFDDLQFKIEKDAKFEDEMLDDDVKSLDGLNVRLTGYILPTTLFKETDIDQFVLVRDNQECCFGPGAALFDCVIVEMQDGHTTDFKVRPVTVHGKLKIDTEKYKYPGGKGPRGTTHFAIFRIEGQKVN